MTTRDTPEHRPGPFEEDLDKALKKPSATAKTAVKGGKDAREARLGAALRENLRRRKASTREND